MYQALRDTGAQCTLMPSSYKEVEPPCISELTGGSQELTVLEAEVSRTGKEWQKLPTGTGPEAMCIQDIVFFRNGYFKVPKEHGWGFGIAALEMEDIKELSTSLDLPQNPSVVGLLRVEEQQVPMATMVVHLRQRHAN